MTTSNPPLRSFVHVGRQSGINARILWGYRGEAGSSGWETAEVPASIFFVEKGGIDLVLDGGSELRCGIGDLFLGKRAVRRQKIIPGSRLVSIAYEMTWGDRHPVYGEGLNVRIAAKAVTGDAACRRLRAASRALVGQLHPGRGAVDFSTATHGEAPDAGHALRQQIAFWAWFERLQAVFDAAGIRPSFPQARSGIVREVQALLDARPLGEPFHGVEASLPLSVGWRRVQQLFKDELNQTPHDYFDARRVEHACRRLRSQGVSVKEVATELGFRSLSHFSDWFKKRTGLAPRRFLFGP